MKRNRNSKTKVIWTFGNQKLWGTSKGSVGYGSGRITPGRKAQKSWRKWVIEDVDRLGMMAESTQDRREWR